VDVTGAEFYRAVLEDLATGIEALDTTPYRWSDSDRFAQARYMDADRGGSKHLEVWVDLGSATGTPGLLTHQSQIVIVHRYSPDDDSLSQARIHGATRAVWDWLEPHRGPNGVRYRPTGYTIEALSAEWVVTRITVDTRIPRAV
jgi:DNA-binding beta-propeller fold protein YncE